MDTHFKGLVPKLEKAAHLRENYLLGQERFKEILGLSLSTSLRKSLEALALELGKEQTKKWLELTTENTRLVLIIKPNTHPPVKLRSITRHFNALTEAAEALISAALPLRDEIIEGSIARNIRWEAVMILFFPSFLIIIIFSLRASKIESQGRPSLLIFAWQVQRTLCARIGRAGRREH